ncbi:adaptin-binding domain-containing protein [Aspergillus lucknowensis]|uniref:Alpha and gamma adaptin binding protein p34-domain-containing protein n=1 Tax=Aspergillus lucknowensis TaxID=176173 RepID=A0ABR4M213_9EURO
MATKNQNDAPKGKGKGKGREIRNPRRLLILSPSSPTHPHTDSLIPYLLQTLTGHAANPPAQAHSFAGYTTHPPLRIENRYYTAEVPIWVDEIPIPTSTSTPGTTAAAAATTDTEQSTSTELVTSREGEGEGQGEGQPSSQWAKEFSSEEAQVVRDAIGAVMICFRNPSPPPKLNIDGQENVSPDNTDDHDDVRELKSFVRAIGTVRALIEEERGEIGAVPGLLVLGVKRDQQKKSKKADVQEEQDSDPGLIADLELGEGLDDPFSVAWWEDQLVEMGLMGFEVIEWDLSRPEAAEEKRNLYGELQGMRRVKEVLETHEWAGDDGEDIGLLDDDDDLERELLGSNEGGGGLDTEVNELEREMVGLKLAIGRPGDDDDDEGDEEIRVDAVEALLLRMRAIKDMSDELPEQDRKRFAAKAIRDIMKEL